MTPILETIPPAALALALGAAAGTLAAFAPADRPARLAGFLAPLAGMFAEAGADHAAALRGAVLALAEIEAAAAAADGGGRG